MSFKCFFTCWFHDLLLSLRKNDLFLFFLFFLLFYMFFPCFFVDLCFVFIIIIIMFFDFFVHFFRCFFNILIFVCDCGICSVCSCSFCVFFLIPFWMRGLFFSVVVWYFFEFLRNFHKFSVFFARIATFRSSPLRSIPGLFNENSYDLMHTYYCDVLW